eukprot:TRINITY_DN24413_c0_g2_i1.p1 TRINITY_DN24413_c0_g2~~TRINITY_DN24413_c0_g2_i1.p1  ORF type:complete len:372 (+),score=27.32 TRINITY_DN24413_c0_g2_i1:107-1117(+)
MRMSVPTSSALDTFGVQHVVVDKRGGDEGENSLLVDQVVAKLSQIAADELPNECGISLEKVMENGSLYHDGVTVVAERQQSDSFTMQFYRTDEFRRWLTQRAKPSNPMRVGDAAAFTHPSQRGVWILRLVHNDDASASLQWARTFSDLTQPTLGSEVLFEELKLTYGARATFKLKGTSPTFSWFVTSVSTLSETRALSQQIANVQHSENTMTLFGAGTGPLLSVDLDARSENATSGFQTYMLRLPDGMHTLGKIEVTSQHGNGRIVMYAWLGQLERYMVVRRLGDWSFHNAENGRSVARLSGHMLRVECHTEYEDAGLLLVISSFVQFLTSATPET